jgi:hypothetical protein
MTNDIAIESEVPLLGADWFDPLEASYAQKLVTGWRDEGGVSWGCSRLHFSSKGVIRRVRW